MRLLGAQSGAAGFPEEAPGRASRGQASQEEHDALVDEGIPVARFPIPPTGSLN